MERDVTGSDRTVDVVVVGAGPAGCAAAITARRHGLDVVVVDRAAFPRDKICGDGLTTSALRELEALGLDPSAVASWIVVDDVLVRAPDGRRIVLPLPRGRGMFGAVARRADLDAALVDLARASGAEIRERTAVTGVAPIDDAVAVTTDDGTRLRARHVIAADGMWSPTRKFLGVAAPDYRGEWHAFRQYWRSVSDDAAHRLMVWFEPDLLPGYAWSFPLGDGSANVGFGILRSETGYRVGDMGQLWREIVARPHVRAFLGEHAEPEGPHRAWPIPARVGRLRPSHGRTLFVGDAAAAADPMTGEGIGQALQTGRWAAEAIAAHPDAPLRVARAYDTAVRHHLTVDHRFAELLMRVLERRGPTSAVLRLVDASDWTRRNFARWMFEDYPRAYLFTPSRWHPGVFDAPGAYRDLHAHATD